MSATPAYPLPRPANNADTRFSLGPALDIAADPTRYGHRPSPLARTSCACSKPNPASSTGANDASDQPLDKPSPIGNQIPPSRPRKSPDQRKCGSGL